jgi:hypothetical protein
MSCIQAISITATVIFLAIVARLVIKKQLREEFSIIWIMCALILNLFAFWRKGIDVLANFFGVYYPPAIIFMFLFFALIVYSLHLSIIISKQKDQIKNLTQEVALINEKITKNA